MPTVTLLDYSYHTLILVAMLALPSVITAAVVGLLVGFLQAITQVNDASVSQAAKLVATIVVLLITMRWIGHELVTFTQQIFKNFPSIVR
jgi:type III secretion HrpO family protein